MMIPRTSSLIARLMPGLCLAIIMPLVTVAVLHIAPSDYAMGDAQRIVYVHVSVAWFSLMAFVVMAAAGMLYLRQRELRWDAWSQAAAELGWLCCGLTLLTGSFWAHEAWGTWWTWDPRLTTSLILWLIYSGCLILRGSVVDAHRRARVCAVVATLGLLDLPLVTMATRWFRGIHPVAPQMEPAMRVVLLFSVSSFTALLAVLLVRRQAQLRLQCQLMDLQSEHANDLRVSPAKPI